MITIAPCVSARINHRWSALDAKGRPACAYCGAPERETIRAADVQRYHHKRKGTQ